MFMTGISICSQATEGSTHADSLASSKQGLIAPLGSAEVTTHHDELMDLSRDGQRRHLRLAPLARDAVFYLLNDSDSL